MTIDWETDPIRIVLINDAETVIYLCQLLFSAEDDFVLAGGAYDGETGLEVVEQTRPDVVVMDLMHPPAPGAPWDREAGIREIARMRQLYPDLVIYVKTQAAEIGDERVEAAYAAGARLVEDSLWDVEVVLTNLRRLAPDRPIRRNNRDAARMVIMPMADPPSPPEDTGAPSDEMQYLAPELNDRRTRAVPFEVLYELKLSTIAAGYNQHPPLATLLEADPEGIHHATKWGIHGARSGEAAEAHVRAWASVQLIGGRRVEQLWDITMESWERLQPLTEEPPVPRLYRKGVDMPWRLALDRHDPIGARERANQYAAHRRAIRSM